MQVDDPLESAHNHCALHRGSILRSSVCGCFHCEEIFAPSEITTWIDDVNVKKGLTGQTALCPHCGIDAVIGSDSGLSITPEFLAKMRGRWFS